MSARQLQIQILFENALYISASDEPELLRLVFNDQYMFIGLNGIPMEFPSQV